MQQEIQKHCQQVYDRVYAETTAKKRAEILAKKRSKGIISDKQADEIDRIAQKEAIKQALLQTMREFDSQDPAEVWKMVYRIHVHHKSGVDDEETIKKVISADQSWKKSSGHAFEEMIKLLENDILKSHGIEIILQRDLNIYIKAGELHNEPRDISWLKEQIKGEIFDLYATINKDGKRYCFGCIQAKTSIRDRVTRDREPSIQAMKSFFWSVIMTLDGDFLKLPKFVNMVNGNSAEFKENGWHGMYVFSNIKPNDRIYNTSLDLETFSTHAIKAAEQWLSQRQWLNTEWKPDER